MNRKTDSEVLDNSLYNKCPKCSALTKSSGATVDIKDLYNNRKIAFASEAKVNILFRCKCQAEWSVAFKRRVW